MIIKDFLYDCQMLLPLNAFDVEITEDNELHWKMPAPEEDDAETFLLWYDPVSKLAGWEAGEFPAGGEYFADINTVEDFEKALEEWETNPMTWNN